MVYSRQWAITQPQPGFCAFEFNNEASDSCLQLHLSLWENLISHWWSGFLKKQRDNFNQRNEEKNKEQRRKKTNKRQRLKTQTFRQNKWLMAIYKLRIVCVQRNKVTSRWNLLIRFAQTNWRTRLSQRVMMGKAPISKMLQLRLNFYIWWNAPDAYVEPTLTLGLLYHLHYTCPG